MLGSFGKARRHVQILNRHDPVGFGGTRGKRYEAEVRAVLANLGEGSFQVYLDDSHDGHRISRRALNHVCKLLKAW